MSARATGQDQSDRQPHDRGSPSDGPSVVDIWWSTPVLADKIVKGAKAADLPGEESTTVEVGVNVKTARAVGLAIPPSILLHADQVIA